MFDTYERFSQLPSMPRSRSSWTNTSRHYTTFNFGELVPIYWKYMLPGETLSLDAAAEVRMSTPIYPVMSDAFLDVTFFAVPLRLLWQHWEEFNGANPDSPWAQTIDYQIPQLTIPSNGFAKGTVADHFGVPLNNSATSDETISDLPFRAYAKIFNDWWRDENVDNPTYFTTQDATLTGSSSGSAVYGGKLCKVNKFHDLFTSALPSPQKGPAVSFGLSGVLPVDYSTTPHSVSHNLTWSTTPDLVTGQNYSLRITGNGSGTGNPSNLASTSSGAAFTTNAAIDNAVVDLGNATAITVSDLRVAVATQRVYESLARAGSRYTEILQSLYNVQPLDSRLQRSEYIGGKKFPINMQQVVQTSETNTEQLGTVGAYSLTRTGRNNMLTYTSTEHMIVIGLACARTRHSYQQGLDRWWSMKSKFDFYWPQLAHISEQPVLNKEIYFSPAIADATKNNQAFGYQEAWYQYRYQKDYVTGSFRSTGSPGLDSWLYVDYYKAMPTLSESWMAEGVENVDRTLAVQSTTSDQLIAAFAFPTRVVSPMPLYSVPGLLDHF